MMLLLLLLFEHFLQGTAMNACCSRRMSSVVERQPGTEQNFCLGIVMSAVGEGGEGVAGKTGRRDRMAEEPPLS